MRHLHRVLLSGWAYVGVIAADQHPIWNDAHPYYERAVALMEESPLIDTHVDLPQIVRSLGRRPLDVIPQVAEHIPGHIDIPRMKQGHLSALFMTVWAPCHELVGEDPGPDFNTPTNALRDSLEMLDLIQNMIKQHPEHWQFAHSSQDIRDAFNTSKIGALLGMEGTHLLGNSLGAMRIFAQMGVRYLTLTHTCHSAFASSNGAGDPKNPMVEVHSGNGLTKLGEELVRELNRLGVLVDLSHTSDQTAKQALAVSRAPVVWTHSGARALWDHPRNIPDDVLDLVGEGEGKNKGVIHSIFYPHFIGPTEGANVSRVADHIEYIARKVGKKHVGIGSDFDGMFASVEGLEDATRYPNLVAEILSRGWTDNEVLDLMGRNLLRVMDEVDQVKADLQSKLPSSEVWEKRKDLPAKWGGPNDWYYPLEARKAINEAHAQVKHDEL